MLLVLLMVGRARVGVHGSYRGHSSCNPRSDLDFMGRTGTTADWGAREGAMVQTPTPHTKAGRKIGAVDRTVEKEVGQCRRNNVLGDEDKIFVRP